jgi:hypothetical protein
VLNLKWERAALKIEKNYSEETLPGMSTDVWHIITRFLPCKDIVSLKLTSKVHHCTLHFFQDAQPLLDVAYTLAVKLHFYSLTKSIIPSSALSNYQEKQQKIHNLYQTRIENFWRAVSNDIENITLLSEQEILDLLYLNPKALSLLPAQVRSNECFQQIALLSWTSSQKFFHVGSYETSLSCAGVLYQIDGEIFDDVKKFCSSSDKSVLDHDIPKMYKEIEKWSPNNKYFYQHHFIAWQKEMNQMPFLSDWGVNQNCLDGNPEDYVENIKTIIGAQISIVSMNLSPRLRWLCTKAPMLYYYLWPQVPALKDDKELSIIAIRQCHGKVVKIANPKFSFDKEYLFQLLCTHIGPEIYTRDIKPSLPAQLQQDVELLEMEEKATKDKSKRLEYHYADLLYINSGNWDERFLTLAKKPSE